MGRWFLSALHLLNSSLCMFGKEKIDHYKTSYFFAIVGQKRQVKFIIRTDLNFILGIIHFCNLCNPKVYNCTFEMPFIHLPHLFPQFLKLSFPSWLVPPILLTNFFSASSPSHIEPSHIVRGFNIERTIFFLLLIRSVNLLWSKRAKDK